MFLTTPLQFVEMLNRVTIRHGRSTPRYVPKGNESICHAKTYMECL